MAIMSPTIALMNADRNLANDESDTLREVRLWIDGVGCWLLWMPEQLTIGGPRRIEAASSPDADLQLLADLRSRHAVIERSGEHYVLAPCGQSAINGRPVTGATPLRSGDELTFGADVRFSFSVPTSLSNSARLTCTSGHRPSERLDGLILLEQVCQIGPQPDHHVQCPGVEAPLVLFRKGAGLWCRSPEPWKLNESLINGSAELHHGAVLSTESIQLRVEIT